MKKTIRLRQVQHGAVLIISLVLLVGVTLVSLSSIHTGLMELTMSGNEEARMTAFQQAQAGVESVLAEAFSDDSDVLLAGLVGASNCTASKSGETCDQTSLSFHTGIDANKHWAKSERLNPLLACPPRVFATSCDNFQVAHFSVDSRFDDVATRGGRAEVVEGFMKFKMDQLEELVITDNEFTP